MEKQKFSYDNKIVKLFTFATILWGAVGMLVGLLIATQLAFPFFNFNLAETSFGRVRPIHTNAIIFAFVGNGIFTGVYYSLQRLLKTRMFSDVLSKIHFWGWQLIIVLAALTLTLGYTTGKEYAELEWPIDILIAGVWVVFGWNMIGTIIKRRVQHMYVAIWFYIATFVTVALLHIVNSIELPISFMKSYPVYAGVQDALVQWWYGHNAVAFFLTTPYLGLMYYFIPKASNKPIYSYRLSILHFWALIFIYIWTGPHHLLYQALPDWIQTLGVTFSIMLLAPSWGGMVNGLLTLRGAWDKVRQSADLKFLVAAVVCYGMATFEGPMLSLKSVNAIIHFTDWTIAHAHIGGMGWNGFLTFGMLYWLVPKLFKTKIYSQKWGNIHFWLGVAGLLLYTVPLYIGSIVQNMMHSEFNEAGNLAYPVFFDSVEAILSAYHWRIVGGFLYLSGFILMIVNIIKTVKTGSFEDNEMSEAAPLTPIAAKEDKKESLLSKLSRKPTQFIIWTLIAVTIGGVVEMIPAFLIKSNIPTIDSVKPYTPLELQGRDVYLKEGCVNCHSQMVRPFRWEEERFGEYSKAGEFVYDHPFLWSSKRTGPDLARAGTKLYKANIWHYKHFEDPLLTIKGSIMPAYPWLLKKELDISTTGAKIRGMQKLGVPYPEGYDEVANEDLKKQAEEIASSIRSAGEEVTWDKEVIALIAYLQRLGKDIQAAE